MKKLTIILLALFFVGITNINAQTDAITSEEVSTEEVSTEEVKKECPFTKNAEGKLVCVKTGKVCDDSCKNKAKGTCCKGKRKRCSGKSGKYNKASKNYSSSGNSGFNFSKKSSCSKVAKKCGEDCTKACCAKTDESSDSDEDGNSEE